MDAEEAEAWRRRLAAKGKPLDRLQNLSRQSWPESRRISSLDAGWTSI
jgi:hypothetical protein